MMQKIGYPDDVNAKSVMEREPADNHKTDTQRQDFIGIW